jgi:glutathione synthase/RimK-type ligase-like ATP-grasp enzyme
MQALLRRGVDAQWLEAPLTAVKGGQLLYDGKPMQHFDAIVPRYAKAEGSAALDFLRDSGVPVMNDTEAVATTSSKLNSDKAMAAHGVPRIPTNWASSAKDADNALAGIEGDICVKPYDGESGEGVEFFTNKADAKRHIEEHFAKSDTLLSVQPKVGGAKVSWKHPELGDVQSGMDYRVLVTRDKFDEPYVDSILQRIGAAGSDKSNLDAGGWGRVVDPKNEHVPAGIIETALKAAKSVPGRYEVGGVDIIPVGRDPHAPVNDHRAQQFLTTEINSSPGIPDQNYGTAFSDAIANRAVILGERSRAGHFV